jgi:uncharacterized protein
MKAKIRVVLDPNIIGSILLGGYTRQYFIECLEFISHLEFCYCTKLIDEIVKFSTKRYFKERKIDRPTVDAFLNYFISFAIRIHATSKVKLSRDGNDDYLLSLCRDANADFLVTGDPDLLSLKAYSQAKIYSMPDFLTHLKEQLTKIS